MFDTEEMQRLNLQHQMPTWVIREVLPHDARCLMQYCQQMAQERPNLTSLRAYLLPDRIDGYHELIDTYRSHRNSCLFVVVDDLRIVGMIKVTGNDNPLTAHIVELSVNILPEYRGRGIGSALLERAITWSKQHDGIRRIQLDVLAHNGKAIQLYERLGFLIEGYRHGAYHLSDVRNAPDFDAFTMGMTLS